MYIDIVPNRNSPPAILLRQSVRQGKRITKITLANLSQWDHARVEALRRALRGEFDRGQAGPPTSGPVFGVLYTLKQIAEACGLPKALGTQKVGKLQLLVVLARVAGQKSRLSMVRWADDHAVEEVLGLPPFDEDDLYEALDQFASRQSEIEQVLYRHHVNKKGKAPVLFLYDVTSTYLEGEKNELAAFGYNRDKKAGKLQIVFGLLTDEEGEPLAIRVFKGNTADCTTVSSQIEILREQFGVHEVVLVGDRGMVRARGKEALTDVGFRYLTALTEPEIRGLLRRGVIQLSLFDEQVCEVQADGVRYILRKNPSEARKEGYRLEDKVRKLKEHVAARNKKVVGSLRCQVEAGKKTLQEWIQRYKLGGVVGLEEDGRALVVRVDEGAKEKALELAGCYCVVTDVPKEVLEAEAVHARYKDLGKVERDFRSLKTAFLEVRPVFVRKEERTRGHLVSCMLALKVLREMERRLAAVYGTTATDPYAVTVANALAALGRLCLLEYQAEGVPSFRSLPNPDEHQEKILQALGVRLPRK